MILNYISALVVEIILNKNSGMSWDESLKKSIPPRKVL